MEHKILRGFLVLDVLSTGNPIFLLDMHNLFIFLKGNPWLLNLHDIIFTIKIGVWEQMHS